MDTLARIAQSATPSTAVQFRKQAYGKKGVHDFLRDVLAIANASADGNRYIITGVEFDQKGDRLVSALAESDFSGKPAYEALANEHIEPPIRIRYQPVTIDGKRVGVFEIGDCRDRPYMMRVDHSEHLRRGDAYMRVNDAAVKMGRRQLQTLFEKQFRDSISATSLEIGFPGDIIHKDLRVKTRNLARLPSAVASARLTQLLEARSPERGATTNSMLARLTHARVFGSDEPYENRSTDEIIQEMRQIKDQYHDHDNHFLFEQHHDDIQLVIVNHGDEPLRDAAISLVMPTHEAFNIAASLPLRPEDGGFVERCPTEQADYPTVNPRDGAIHVAIELGDVEPEQPVDVFATPLRICVDDELQGRRVGIQYTMTARNLRAPAKGTLRLLF